MQNASFVRQPTVVGPLVFDDSSPTACPRSVQVPVIDLSQDDDEVLRVLKRACTTTGFFYGASKQLLDLSSCLTSRLSAQDRRSSAAIMVPHLHTGGHCATTPRGFGTICGIFV